MEKHYAHGLDLHVLFIEFTQAFVCVNGEKLFEIMYKYGISKKLIRLVQMSMSATKAKVRLTITSVRSLNLTRDLNKVTACPQPYLY
jgi:hypothetical protein